MGKPNQWHTAALDAMQDGVIIIDPDLNVEFMNRAIIRIFGKGTGRKCFRVLYGRADVCPKCQAPAVFERRETRRSQRYSPNADRIFDVTEQPLEDSDGAISKLTIYRDVTEYRRHEEKLRASKQDYRSLFEHVACGVFVSSKEGKFLDANQALLDMLGYDSKEEFFKIDIARDLYLKPEERQRFQELIERNGKVVDYEVYFKRKDGRPVPVLLTGHVRYDERGKVVGYEGLNVDLTQRREMEYELEKTRVQLLQAEKMASLGKLAAGVAHQLNNPLGGITLFANLILEDYELPSDARRDLKRILGDSQRCSDIVKQLLQFSRQTQGEIRDCNINQALSQTLFLLENQTLFQNIEIEKQFEDKLPLVPVDIQQMNHVFMNIVLNGADAMEGRGTLSLATYRAEHRSGVCIRISDTGPGISSAVLPRIFEPFFTTKEEGKGTGLGLSMAYGIVENHGGRITACSTPGEGTAFVIELPLNRNRK